MFLYKISATFFKKNDSILSLRVSLCEQMCERAFLIFAYCCFSTLPLFLKHTESVFHLCFYFLFGKFRLESFFRAAFFGNRMASPMGGMMSVSLRHGFRCVLEPTALIVLIVVGN